VSISFDEVRRDAHSTILSIEVRDTGIGIAPDKVEAVFEPFTQADGSMTRRYGGTGLGLTITAQLVRLMGGEISVRSDVGNGATFAFTLRLGLPSAAESATAPVEAQPDAGSDAGRKLRILVTEDNLVNQRLIGRLLQKWGHDVTIVSSGDRAVAATASDRFDLVLMDVQMPGMDGFDATRAIRARERNTGDRLTIIAITAHAMKGDRERCLDAGMDGYVSKPVEAAELRRTIAAISG
jgi:CheY-like chemotaxis protein